MKITGLSIDKFGIWSGLAIDSFPVGTTVFFGPNEAGKSTLLQFVRTMLYGFTDDRSRRFVEKYDGDRGILQVAGRVGGSLSMVAREHEFHLFRHASLTAPNDPAGELRVTSQDGQRHGSDRLATLLADIDETIFNNVFAVGLHELQHLGTLNDTQAARFLYNLSTGTDRVSLVDVMRQLQETGQRLVGTQGSEAYLLQLLDRQAACRERIKQLGLQGDLWAQLRSELDRVDEEVSRLESGREKTLQRTEQAELALRALPLWDRRRALQIELDALGQVPVIPAEVFQRLQVVDQEMAVMQGRCDEQTAHVQQFERDLQAHTSASGLTRQLARIEALLDQQATITNLHDEVRRLSDVVDESELELQAEQERLGMRTGEDTIVPQFDAATFASLRDPARQLEQLRGLLEQAKKDATAAKDEAQAVEQYLAESLGKQPDWFEGKDERDIVRTLEQTGEVASALRQRAQLEQRVQDTQRQLETLNKRRQRLLSHQLLPWEVIKALGAMFAVGSMLLIWALLGNRFGLSDQLRTGLGIMGGIGVATATLLKLVLQSASQDDLDLCHRDIERMQRRVEEAEDELHKLARKLPAQPAGSVKLRDAETRIVRLESLLPIEGQRRRMLERAAAAERLAVEYANQMKEARRQWEEQLGRLGLSRNLTPTQVRELAGDTGNLVHLHHRHEEAVEQLERARRELEVYRERMRELMAAAGLGGKAGTALDELGHLQLHLNQHREHRNEHQRLQERLRRGQRDQQQTSARLHDLQRRRENILSSAGAIDDEDLDNMRDQRQQLESLQQQHQDVSQEVRNLLGQDAESLTTILNGGDQAALQKRATAGRSELARSEERLKELLLRRGQVDQRLYDLRANRELDQARSELAELEAKLDAGIRQWKTISAITALLKTVYKRYEKERQPETLKEASQHFSRMTGGRYRRVWTPLDEDVLIVEGEGESLRVAELSRGTREQLFLALRLALVSGYARRGVRMPMVLDDVLVNFDQQRTQAAAEVLVDFARAGHQLLVFTCHEHVTDVFRTAGAHVQLLPSQEQARDGKLQVLTGELPRVSEPSAVAKKKKRSRRRDACYLGFTGDEAAAAGSSPPARAAADLLTVGSSATSTTPAFDAGRDAPSGWTSVDDWEFGEFPATGIQPDSPDYVEQRFPMDPGDDDQSDDVPDAGSEAEAWPAHDWDPARWSEGAFADAGSGPPDMADSPHEPVEHRVDEPQRPQPAFRFDSPPTADIKVAVDHDPRELRGPVPGSADDVAQPPAARPDSSHPGEEVIDLPISAEARDLTPADFARPPEFFGFDELTRLGSSIPAFQPPADEDTVLDAGSETPSAMNMEPFLDQPPESADDSQPLQTESSAELGSAENIWSTPETNLPIDFPGSAAMPAEPSEPSSDQVHKETPMSTVDRFVSEALPPETPLEPALPQDAAPAHQAEGVSDEYVDEYVDADEDDDDDDYEVATATGDVEDAVEFEYEYVDADEDDDEDSEDGDEYEYVEVEVDEDGNEIEAVAVEDDEAIDDDQYEYVDADEDDEDDDEYEVAIATGDVKDDVEYEYEYIDDDDGEDDDSDDADLTAEADDDEYEYEYEDEE